VNTATFVPRFAVPGYIISLTTSLRVIRPTTLGQLADARAWRRFDHEIPAHKTKARLKKAAGIGWAFEGRNRASQAETASA